MKEVNIYCQLSFDLKEIRVKHEEIIAFLDRNGLTEKEDNSRHTGVLITTERQFLLQIFRESVSMRW